MKTFSDINGYKFNSQKLVTFLYTNNKLTKTREITTLRKISNNINYRKLIVIKQMKDLEDEILHCLKNVNKVSDDKKIPKFRIL